MKKRLMFLAAALTLSGSVVHGALDFSSESGWFTFTSESGFFQVEIVPHGSVIPTIQFQPEPSVLRPMPASAPVYVAANWGGLLLASTSFTVAPPVDFDFYAYRVWDTPLYAAEVRWPGSGDLFPTITPFQSNRPDEPVAPVPETGTLLAGALLLLPFGVAAFRKLRRAGC
ncbi:MAG: hypothetical protein AB9869_13930 [Verrucomicrobiia bacterium]